MAIAHSSGGSGGQRGELVGTRQDGAEEPSLNDPRGKPQESSDSQAGSLSLFQLGVHDRPKSDSCKRKTYQPKRDCNKRDDVHLGSHTTSRSVS